MAPLATRGANGVTAGKQSQAHIIVLTCSFALENRNSLNAQVDPEGDRSTFTYDAMDRLVRYRNPADQVTTIVYDDWAATRVINPAGFRTSVVYSERSRKQPKSFPQSDIQMIPHLGHKWRVLGS